MASVSRERDRAQLDQELRTVEHQHLLGILQQSERFFQQFLTWADVIGFMRTGTSTDPRKDDILRPIFEAHSTDQDPRWRAILLAIFWPGLESIHFQKRGWDPDSRERWQNIVWAFLQVVCRVDIRQRPDRLVQKVFNDTIHRLHDECQRAWTRASRERVKDPQAINALAGGVAGIDFTGIALREAQEIALRRLQEHLQAGRISEADFFLLVGTRVYGQSVADYAREAGLDYQVAKKRRQRAEAAIGRFERNAWTVRNGLSPSGGLTPLLLGEDVTG